MKTSLFVLLLLALFSCGNKNSNSAGDQLILSGFEKNRIKDSSVVTITKSERVITVGGEKAEIKGFTSQSIQIAVDAIHHFGGGTVKLLPGKFEIMGPVRLFSNVSLTGSGPSTLLKKTDGIRSEMIMDAGYGEIQVTLKDASGFKPGMGIQIYDDTQKIDWDATTAVVTAVKGNTVYFDNYLIRDYTTDDHGVVSNTCPLISAVEAENIIIADLAIDGNRMRNESMDGCRGGAIYLHKVKNVLIDKVNIKNFANDGISWQITEDVTVRNCEISGCANAGLHPGTGSPRTIIMNNYSHDNDHYGLFVCWRVKHGVVSNNRFERNGLNGICTGHMDTDMLFENNTISENAEDGVLFRNENKSNAPHRNIFRNNIIENNGSKNGGYAFTIDSPAENVLLEGNTIRNSKGNSQKAAVHYTRNSIPVKLINNKLNNLPNGETVSD